MNNGASLILVLCLMNTKEANTYTKQTNRNRRETKPHMKEKIDDGNKGENKGNKL